MDYLHVHGIINVLCCMKSHFLRQTRWVLERDPQVKFFQHYLKGRFSNKGTDS